MRPSRIDCARDHKLSRQDADSRRTSANCAPVFRDLPEAKKPRGICLLLQGLTEYLEKYDETADRPCRCAGSRREYRLAQPGRFRAPAAAKTALGHVGASMNDARYGGGGHARSRRCRRKERRRALASVARDRLAHSMARIFCSVPAEHPRRFAAR
jgi:hypothetical protein